MKNFTQLEAEVFIVNYMISHHYIGHKQTTFDNMVRYVPSSDRKVVKEALEELIRKGFIFTKSKHYGVHISIVPSKLDDVRNYVESLENRNIHDR